MQAPEKIRSKIKEAIEADGDSRIYDLHVWSVGPDIYASEIGIVADNPLPSSTYYNLLPKEQGLVHVRIETRKCTEVVQTSPGKHRFFQS